MQPNEVTIQVRIKSGSTDGVPTTEEMHAFFKNWGQPYNIDINTEMVVTLQG